MHDFLLRNFGDRNLFSRLVGDNQSRSRVAAFSNPTFKEGAQEVSGKI